MTEPDPHSVDDPDIHAIASAFMPPAEPTWTIETLRFAIQVGYGIHVSRASLPVLVELLAAYDEKHQAHDASDHDG